MGLYTMALNQEGAGEVRLSISCMASVCIALPGRVWDVSLFFDQVFH